MRIKGKWMQNGQKQLKGHQVEALNQSPHKAITHANQRYIDINSSPVLFWGE